MAITLPVYANCSSGTLSPRVATPAAKQKPTVVGGAQLLVSISSASRWAQLDGRCFLRKELSHDTSGPRASRQRVVVGGRRGQQAPVYRSSIRTRQRVQLGVGRQLPVVRGERALAAVADASIGVEAIALAFALKSLIEQRWRWSALAGVAPVVSSNSMARVPLRQAVVSLERGRTAQLSNEDGFSSDCCLGGSVVAAVLAGREGSWRAWSLVSGCVPSRVSRSLGPGPSAGACLGEVALAAASLGERGLSCSVRCVRPGVVLVIARPGDARASCPRPSARASSQGPRQSDSPSAPEKAIVLGVDEIQALYRTA
jgi:hypothetical protein